MNKLELYQEIVDVVSPTTIVEWGNLNCFDVKYNKIILTKHFEKGLDRALIALFNFDDGFKLYNYCSYETWRFLHELGHAIKGDTELDYTIIVPSLKQGYNNGTISRYEALRLYKETEDERMANEWAYEFLKKNKKVIKRLEKELYKSKI